MHAGFKHEDKLFWVMHDEKDFDNGIIDVVPNHQNL